MRELEVNSMNAGSGDGTRTGREQSERREQSRAGRDGGGAGQGGRAGEGQSRTERGVGFRGTRGTGRTRNAGVQEHRSTTGRVRVRGTGGTGYGVPGAGYDGAGYDGAGAREHKSAGVQDAGTQAYRYTCTGEPAVPAPPPLPGVPSGGHAVPTGRGCPWRYGACCVARGRVPSGPYVGLPHHLSSAPPVRPPASVSLCVCPHVSSRAPLPGSPLAGGSGQGFR
jgi:hypothetical protein